MRRALARARSHASSSQSSRCVENSWFETDLIKVYAPFKTLKPRTMRFSDFSLVLLLSLFLSAVEGFSSLQIPKRKSFALTVTKKDMLDAPSQPSPKTSSGAAKRLGKKGKRKAKSEAAAAIADAINGKPPKKKAT